MSWMDEREDRPEHYGDGELFELEGLEFEAGFAEPVYTDRCVMWDSMMGAGDADVLSGDERALALLRRAHQALLSEKRRAGASRKILFNHQRVPMSPEQYPMIQEHIFPALRRYASQGHVMLYLWPHSVDNGGHIITMSKPLWSITEAERRLDATLPGREEEEEA